MWNARQYPDLMWYSQKIIDHSKGTASRDFLQYSVSSTTRLHTRTLEIEFSVFPNFFVGNIHNFRYFTGVDEATKRYQSNIWIIQLITGVDKPTKR